MKLVELGEQWLVFSRALWERARKSQAAANPADSEFRSVSVYLTNPAIEAALLTAIEQCADIAELKAFTDLDENFEMPLQSRFNALERRLELGDSSSDALELYRLTLHMYYLRIEYEVLANQLLSSLTQFQAENAPPEAYEQLRAKTVERIKELRQENIYPLDPPEKWQR